MRAGLIIDTSRSFGECIGMGIGRVIGGVHFVWAEFVCMVFGGVSETFSSRPSPQQKIIDYFLSRRLRVGGRVTCETRFGRLCGIFEQFLSP
jgi:hypothetical protein